MAIQGDDTKLLDSPKEIWGTLSGARKSAFYKKHAIDSGVDPDDSDSLSNVWEGWGARPKQCEPDGDWDIWFAMTGRGWGKTRTGAEWIKKLVDSGRAKSLALLGNTVKDIRQVMVTGPAGILRRYADYPEDERPHYKPSLDMIEWPNGAVARLFSAADSEGDNVRGYEYDMAWCDELAKWPNARNVWDQLQFALRQGEGKTLITSTPNQKKIIRDIVAGNEGVVRLVRGFTTENRTNLSKRRVAALERRYADSRLGRQELFGEILSDVPDALFPHSSIDPYKVESVPPGIVVRVIVGVFPSVTESYEEPNEHGIVVLGHSGSDVYVIRDASISGRPAEWAKAAVSQYREFGAESVVIQSGSSHNTYKTALQTIESSLPVVEGQLMGEGRATGCEAMSAMYEQGRVRHVGDKESLELQLSNMSSSGYVDEGEAERLFALTLAFNALVPSMIDSATQPAKGQWWKKWKPKKVV